MKITEADAAALMILVRVGSEIIPIIATTVAGLKRILATEDVDPEVYAQIDEKLTGRIAQAQREGETHPAPVDPGNGVGG